MDNIEALDIIFENGDSVLIKKSEFKDFCISNLDQEGNEIPYESTLIKDKLYANFLLININNQIIDNSKLKRLKAKSDITEIMIIFKNNKFIKFIVASSANPFVKNYQNDYEYIYENEDSFGILLSEYNIKYRENLFI